MTARTPRTRCRQVRSSQQAGNIPSINHTLGKFAIHEGCQGALAERLIYDGSHLIAVADRDGAVVTQFLHGPMVDQVLAEAHFDSLSGDRTDVSFIASDHLGSVRGLLSWSDSTSSVVSQSWLSYDAYGNELSTSTTDLGTVGHSVTSEVRSRFGYTGRDRDSESDLQYNRARYYDAGRKGTGIVSLASKKSWVASFCLALPLSASIQRSAGRTGRDGPASSLFAGSR